MLKKRILAITLAACMMFQNVGVPVNAAELSEGTTISVEDESVVQEDEQTELSAEMVEEEILSEEVSEEKEISEAEENQEVESDNVQETEELPESEIVESVEKEEITVEDTEQEQVTVESIQNESIEYNEATGVISNEEPTYELTYTIWSTGVVNISGYTGTASGDLVIPAEIDGYTVERIQHGAFQYETGFDGKLVLPETLQEIDSNAFKGCSGLKGELVIPDSVTVIGYAAFEGCSGFTGTPDLSDNLTEINGNAFKDCTGFSGALNIPDSVTWIGSAAFENCTGFTGELKLPENLRILGGFKNCTGFTGNLIIPEGVTYLSPESFQNCSGFDGILSLPTSLTSLEDSVFSGCTGLTGTLTIPSSIQTIKNWVFKDCTGFTGELNIPEGVTQIRGYAFENCTGLTKVTLPESLTYINGYCFKDCTGLEEVDLNESLKIVKKGMFEGCTSLSSIIIPSDVEEIQETAFAGNSSLKEVHIPRSVSKIDSTAFSNSPQVVICAAEGTYAETYAKENGITFNERNVPATSFYLSNGSVYMQVGEKCQLTPVVEPNDTTEEIVWQSSDSSIAKVTEDGVVIALEKGNVEITATIGELSDTCSVEIYGGNVYYVDGIENFESPHDYESSCNDFWVYENKSAKQISVTFSKDTYVEKSYDYLYIYDENAEQIGKYTANDLAGRIITVSGTKVMVQLVSDSSSEYYGFKVTNISEKLVSDTYSVTFDSQGGSAVAAITNITQGSTVELAEPTKSGYSFAGWYTEKNGKGTRFIEEITVTENTTLYAFWVIEREKCDFAVAEVPNQEYTGSKLIPIPQVFDGEKLLNAGTDYTLTYKNNTNVGTAQIIVKGKGNYSSTMTIEFKIIPANLETISMTVECSDKVYNGKKQISNPIVKHGTKTLKSGKDYTVEFSEDLISLGTVDVTIIGKGSYTGEIETSYRIVENDIAKAVFASIPSQSYAGGEIEPEIVIYRTKADQKNGNALLEDTHYKVSYESNIAVGKGKAVINGLGEYGGSKTVTFTIAKKNIATEGIHVRLVENAENLQYNGKALKPEFEVSYNNMILEEGIDYTLAYSNNINVATNKKNIPTVTIKGKGNYTGTLKEQFAIEPMSLAGAEITVSDGKYNNGKEIKPAVKVVLGQKTLKAGKDYTVEYKNNCEIAEKESENAPTVVITGKGNYTGVLEETFRIYATAASVFVTDKIETQTYTGTEIEPEISVYASKADQKSGNALEKGTDYVVSYSGNVNAGTAKAIITGLDIYGGSKTVSFTIAKKNVTTVGIQVKLVENAENLQYNGTALKPAFEVSYNNMILEEGIDYTLAYSNNINVATNKKNIPTVTIKGKGNYTGTLKEQFAIEPMSLEGAEVTVDNAKYNNGKEVKPSVKVILGQKTLKAGKDYTVEYKNNCEMAEKDDENAPTVVITGKGNYAGVLEETFRIYATAASVFVTDKIGTQTYTGTEIEPEFRVYASKADQKNGTALEKGIDYVVSYSNNMNAGTAKAVITGLGTYGGTKTVSFKIGKCSLADRVIVAVIENELVYTGAKLTPAVAVTDGDIQLVENIDYTISYANNVNVPTNSKKLPTVTIKGKGNYTGTLQENFVINPKEFTETLDVTVKEVCFNEKKAQSKTGITTTVTVKDGTKTLKNGTNYTISYLNNTEVGEIDSGNPPTVVISGKGNYAGSIEKKFRIYGADISTATVAKMDSESYTGEVIEPKPVVTVKVSKSETETLIEGVHYTVSWENNVKVGKAKVIITGIGEYGGTKTATFTILPKWLNNWIYKDAERGRVKYTNVYGKNGDFCWRDEYIYDETGRCVRMNQIEADGSISWYVEFEYDEVGRHIRTNSYSTWDGKEYFLVNYYTKIYDASGKNIRENMYDPDGELSGYVLNYYDENGMYIGYDLYRFDLTTYYDITIPRGQKRILYNSDGTIRCVQNYREEKYDDSDYYTYDNEGYCTRIDYDSYYEECELNRKGQVAQVCSVSNSGKTYYEYVYEDGPEYVSMGITIWAVQGLLFENFHLWENRDSAY